MACSSSSRRIPEFYVVYLPQQSFERLLIPNAFVTFCDGLLPKNAVLSNHMGSLWPVKVKSIDRGVFFLHGWQEFVRDNSIERGDILIFRYNGKCEFSAKIFGNSACERKEYSAYKTSFMDKVKLEEDEEENKNEKDKKEETKENENDDKAYDDYDDKAYDDYDDKDYEDYLHDADADDDEKEEEEDATKEEEEAINKSRLGKRSGGNIGGSKTKVVVKIEGSSERINVVNVAEEEETTIRKSRAQKQSGGNNGGSKKRAATKVEGGSKRTNVVNIEEEEEESTTKTSRARKRPCRNHGGSERKYVVGVEEEEVTIKESRDRKKSCENNGVSEKMPVGRIGGRAKKYSYVQSEEIDVSKYIQSRNPYFIAERRTMSKKNLLHVPAKLLKRWQLKLPNLMFYQNEHGWQWPGYVFTRQDGRIQIGGWHDFCMANHVTLDDRCICEFLQGNDQEKDVINVQIVRNTGSRS